MNKKQMIVDLDTVNFTLINMYEELNLFQKFLDDLSESIGETKLDEENGESFKPREKEKPNADKS